MPTLVEIGPSNASLAQHRRKDATEKIKNLTLADTYIWELWPLLQRLFVDFS